jgi:hypothetical protein
MKGLTIVLTKKESDKDYQKYLLHKIQKQIIRDGLEDFVDIIVYTYEEEKINKQTFKDFKKNIKSNYFVIIDNGDTISNDYLEKVLKLTNNKNFDRLTYNIVNHISLRKNYITEISSRNNYATINFGRYIKLTSKYFDHFYETSFFVFNKKLFEIKKGKKNKFKKSLFAIILRPLRRLITKETTYSLIDGDVFNTSLLDEILISLEKYSKSNSDFLKETDNFCHMLYTHNLIKKELFIDGGLYHKDIKEEEDVKDEIILKNIKYINQTKVGENEDDTLEVLVSKIKEVMDGVKNGEIDYRESNIHTHFNELSSVDESLSEQLMEEYRYIINN